MMTPEEVEKIAQKVALAAVDFRVEQLLSRLLSSLLQSVPEGNYLTNVQACSLLQCSDNELRRLIKAQELLEGVHFTGKHKSRRWIRERLERYLETRGDKAKQLRDIQKWMKS